MPDRSAWPALPRASPLGRVVGLEARYAARTLRGRLSYANVVASLALFIALGGTSYAVIKLPRNSVGSREVKNGSLQRIDLASGAQGRGVRGARGPEGPTGAPGAAGARGPSDIVSAHRENIPMASTGSAKTVDVVTVNVPAGAWWVIGSVSGVVEGVSAVTFRCGLSFGATPGASGADAVLGSGADATRAAGLTLQEGRVLDGPTAIRLRCGPEGDIPGAIARADFAQLTAIRTDNFQSQSG